MNAQGGAVGTTQIAEHLEISPGNLYYHFRNREEIIRELFAGLTSDLDAILRVGPDEPIPVERLVNCYIGGTKVLWRYRFFFAAATDFIGRSCAFPPVLGGPGCARSIQTFGARMRAPG